MREFKLDVFEGPLDLLLHLISKHKLNIYDIEIAVLLEQYLEYMAGLEHEDYEDAADFLEMAARLIYIKTVSMLPVDNEGEELKKELQGSLIEYSLCKMAAGRLAQGFVGGEIFVRAPADIPINKTYEGRHEASELYEAYIGIGEKAKAMKPLKAEIFRPLVSRPFVSVTSKIIHVLKKLFTEGECMLERLYDDTQSKSERVAVFLAVLELTKSGRIFLNDDNSKVFMNSASKKRRIRSDFDETEEKAASGIDEAVGGDNDNENTETQALPENDTAEEVSADSGISAESSDEVSKCEDISANVVGHEANEAVSLEKLAERIHTEDNSAERSSERLHGADIGEEAVTAHDNAYDKKKKSFSEKIGDVISKVVPRAQIDEGEAEISYDENASDKLEEAVISDEDKTFVGESENKEEADISHDESVSDKPEDTVTFDESETFDEQNKTVREENSTEENIFGGEAAVNAFKPNYYANARYYWGFSRTADNRRYGQRL